MFQECLDEIATAVNLDFWSILFLYSFNSFRNITIDQFRVIPFPEYETDIKKGNT
jgi:hypothetical protein